MRNVSDKSCRENHNTHCVYSNFLFFFENRAVYEIILEKYGRAGQATDGNMMRCRKSARIQTNIHCISYFVPFHCDGGNANASLYHVIRTLPFWFVTIFSYASQPKVWSAL